jgi:hypothetical protein
MVQKHQHLSRTIPSLGRPNLDCSVENHVLDATSAIGSLVLPAECRNRLQSKTSKRPLTTRVSDRPDVLVRNTRAANLHAGNAYYRLLLIENMPFFTDENQHAIIKQTIQTVNKNRDVFFTFSLFLVMVLMISLM